MTRDPIIADTREDILAEIQALSDELEAHVMDTTTDDHTPDPIGVVRRVEILQKRITAFDKYGVHSMDQLKADPIFIRDNLLFRAMHSMQNAEGRWATRRIGGVTDAGLITAFDLEAGDGYCGASTDDGQYSCRPGKFSWLTGPGERPEISGTPLARVLRDILHIPLPSGQENVAVEQMSMF